jgi:uncharacterized protein YdeI (YjbR/CyaY-like superfamily)
LKVTFFATAADFRHWLQAHGQTTIELRVGFYKKTSGKPSITYAEALDEALCHGWIDGVRKSLGVDAYTIRFSPRKPKSQWSAVNIRHVERLKKAGRMCSEGLQAFEGATDQPRKYSYEQRNQARFDRESERRFRSNRAAWDFFQARPPWYRRTATFWVMSAKKQETRQKRFTELMSDCECGQLVKPLRKLAVPKRGGTKIRKRRGES